MVPMYGKENVAQYSFKDPPCEKLFFKGIRANNTLLETAQQTII